MKKKDVDCLEGALVVDIAMHICANRDIDAALDEYYWKAKKFCPSFEFALEMPFDKALEIGLCLAGPVAIHFGDIDAARAIVNKDRVVTGDLIGLDVSVNDMMSSNEQLTSDVFVAISRFRYGDWGNVPESRKVRNEAALKRHGGMIVGRYDTCEGPVRIVKRDFCGIADDGTEMLGDLPTVMFSDR